MLTWFRLLFSAWVGVMRPFRRSTLPLSSIALVLSALSVEVEQLAVSPPTFARPADRSRRFPLRRESGGTRSVCASRLLAHLVPADGQVDLDGLSMVALIEGSSPQPPGLVLRLPGQPPWLLPPRPAGVRLVLLPRSMTAGLWQSFPACNDTFEPEAPPALSLLGQFPDHRDSRQRQLLEGLRQRCGGHVARDDVLPVFGYDHLRELLPPLLPVTCEDPPQAGGSSSLPPRSSFVSAVPSTSSQISS